MKKLIALLYLSAFLGAQVPTILQMQDEPQNTAKGEYLFLSFESVPQEAYVGQVFPVKIKAIITRDDFQKIVLHTLDDSDNFDILNPQSEWSKDLNEGYYTNTFYLRAKKPAAKLPDFLIELIDGDRQLDEAELEGLNIELLSVSGDGKYSGVVAQSLVLKSEITNKFDDKSLLVTLQIEAAYSNLRDFKLKNYNGSVDVFREDVALQYIEYDVIVPNFTQSLEFSYFNTQARNFQIVHVPLNVKSDDVSTHTDLNPKESKFELYKDIAVIIFAGLMVGIFIFKRYKIAVVFALLAIAYLFYSNNPYNQITLLPNTVIRVLPTEKSSVFHITDTKLEVEKLMSKNGYVKIMLPSTGRIGWVKEESVEKN